MNVITTESYNDKKNTIIKNQPLRTIARLNELRLENGAFICYKEHRWKLSDGALKGLFKALNMGSQTHKILNDHFESKQRDAFVEHVRRSLVQRKNEAVMLIFSKDGKKLIDVATADKPFMSNEAYFDFAEVILDKHQLGVVDVNSDGYGGVIINAIDPHRDWEIDGLTDHETFQGGICLANSTSKGLVSDAFINRLACMNGMIGESFQDSARLKSMSQSSINRFIKDIDIMARKKFEPSGFAEKVRMANETYASFYELEKAAVLLKNFSSATQEEVEAWIPYLTTTAEYNEIGIDILKQSAKKKRNAKSPMLMWDAINALTHFASHDNGISLSDGQRNHIKGKGGELLCSDYDLADSIISPYDN